MSVAESPSSGMGVVVVMGGGGGGYTLIPNRRARVGNHTIWELGASSTLQLRCYDPTTTTKIRLRLVYVDGDAAATLLRPKRWNCAFICILSI